jgi:glycosyltransferase involved in cell wall biosynthesis
MPFRIALLFDVIDPRYAALCKALAESPADIDVRAIRSRSHRNQQCPNSEGEFDSVRTGLEPSVCSVARPNLLSRLRSAIASALPNPILFQLLVSRPDLILSENFGTSAIQAAVYRLFSPRCRNLLSATEPPSRFGWRERLLLAWADGVLADGDTIAGAFAGRFDPSRIFSLATPIRLDVFLACDASRSGPAAHRLIYAGDLSPEYGAADLSIALAKWAEQNPTKSAEIWWVGEGDLAGVLAAQPLPGNVSQRFSARPEALHLASAFAQCGLLVVPSLADDKQSPVLEALAAGLPVLGSRHNRLVRQLVQDGVNGWLFDPLQPTEMLRALNSALNSPAEQLNQMRDRTRCFARPPSFQQFADRLRQVVEAVMPQAAPASQFEPVRWPEARPAQYSPASYSSAQYRSAR